MRKNKHGFTLLELLVVIAIIAILAAILLPVLGRARSSADTTLCRSNVHQLMMGMSMYVQDIGAYPSADPNGLVDSWYEQLEPFVGAPLPTFSTISRSSVWVCPLLRTA